MEARFFSSVRTVLGAYKLFLKRVPGFFSQRYSGRGMATTIHPYLTPMLKKEQSYTFSPPLGVHGLF
jgi:hypothetical protein